MLFFIGLIIPPAVSWITGGTVHKDREALATFMTPATIAAMIIAGVGVLLMLFWNTQTGWDLVQGAIFGWFAAFMWDKVFKPVRPEGVSGEAQPEKRPQSNRKD
jgi:hypothetical protein